MNIREDMINAKIEGKLQAVTTEKLASCIKTWADFSKFCDMIEDMEKDSSVNPNVLKAVVAASALLPLAGFGASAYSGMKLRQAHKNVLKSLEENPSFPDNSKVGKIYGMITQFAPKVSSNKEFAKNVMEQLYNAPIVTAPMVKDIVEVEKGLSNAGTGAPRISDILKSMRSIQQTVGSAVESFA